MFSRPIHPARRRPGRITPLHEGKGTLPRLRSASQWSNDFFLSREALLRGRKPRLGNDALGSFQGNRTIELDFSCKLERSVQRLTGGPSPC